ncbi:hypothetical protein D9757_006055 [Collybiopsis confluens]|uniref:Uncharacterized protein n=1 Tax=Collybiopsis confluens TaxID=2823264 RepID=A0A8H5HUI1_9AGAR|nr:hypothetical protein D9757_006055 [Collybiopsis confluens]
MIFGIKPVIVLALLTISAPAVVSGLDVSDNRNTVATYDDITTRPSAQTRINEYKGLIYDRSFRVVSYQPADQSIDGGPGSEVPGQPASSPNSLVALSVRAERLGGTISIISAPPGNNMTVHGFAGACGFSDGSQAPPTFVGCVYDVKGYTEGKVVAQAHYGYIPSNSSGQMSMARQAFREVLIDALSFEIEHIDQIRDNTGAQSSAVIAIDDLTYTIE